MSAAVILHGKPSKEEYFEANGSSQSNLHWLPWLQHQLVLNGVLAQTPELPHPYAPVYEDHCAVFEKFMVDEETLLVGHSCGAGFLLRWISEHKNMTFGKVVLVAPSLGYNWGEEDRKFTTFDIDPNIADRVKQLVVFYSDNDGGNVPKTIETLKAIDGIEFIELHMGHFVYNDMGTDEFPELLEACLRDKD